MSLFATRHRLILLDLLVDAPIEAFPLLLILACTMSHPSQTAGIRAEQRGRRGERWTEQRRTNGVIAVFRAQRTGGPYSGCVWLHGTGCCSAAAAGQAASVAAAASVGSSVCLDVGVSGMPALSGGAGVG
ncbi:hypothetical protein NECAME_05232 [Necator americanus]|uniref:Uncharacterized protein n=1 Tax=Necator americanus TaxID=51031 RepID=W2SIN9_NECAM|nr:hypothetical protein NECAME_05232 [Necator americanus]ETN69519.1 hypothetical protein NECAME_05232 [Necator americanus]